MNTNPPRRRSSRNRRSRGGGNGGNSGNGGSGGNSGAPVDRRRDLWRDVPAPSAPEPILPAKNPTALLESLGPAPLPGRLVADQYLATVIERAAGLATALAASADILAGDIDDE